MRRLGILGLVVAIGAGVLAFVLASQSGHSGGYRGSIPPAGISLPDFTLGAATGETVRSRDLHGKVVIVTFLDTECTQSCPIVADQLARGLKLLQTKDRSRVAAMAVSVLPRADTPARVRTFLRNHRAVRQLLYLIGDERRLRPVWKAFAVLPAVDTGSADIHSAGVRVYGPSGEWVSTLRAGVDLTPDNIRHDVLSALR